MDGKEILASSLFTSEDKPDYLYPMSFGVSSALVALRLLSGPDIDGMQWSETWNRMLQGSAHLLGLLVWRVQKEEANELRSELQYKLKKAEARLTELKRLRSEDAKANEKVISIFAAPEQGWLSERKKLQLQIKALLNELKVLDTQNENVVSNGNEKVKKKELLIQSRDKGLEEEERKRRKLEEKLPKAEATREELNETAKREAQNHSSLLLKHKTAFLELVSNQRQLEAEMDRTLRQLEAAKQELDSHFKQKEESISMVQKLSLETKKMRKDLEQKDNFLSAMLKKSKSDSTEKQMFLKEVKTSNARRKHAELETQRWRALCQCRHNRDFLKSNSADDADSKSDLFLGSKGAHLVEGDCSENPEIGLQDVENKVNPKTVLLGSLEARHTNVGEVTDTDAKHLEGLIPSETEEYIIVLEQMHLLETDAFAEQMRLKDEKLESFRWRPLSLELETNRLLTHIEGLNQNMSQLRQGNLKLEALLLDRESELNSLKERFSLLLQPLCHQKTNLNSAPKNLALDHETIWSEVQITKSKPREKEESYPTAIGNPHEVVTGNEDENRFDHSKEKIGVEKVVSMDLDHIRVECMHLEEAQIGEKLASTGNCVVKKDSCPWKMDLHAL